ncbi:RhoGAP-domain-containing protein [Rhizophagus irregularis]|uniref:RhoGAP-domain-containing protein n=1 Tax=Rhizophagus irregularis TaxID=588596 RepID=A0A2I1GHP7_9GLOM|nr:RhoGAP-domain-containing protein [Rhizophagus irregularis]
MPPLPPRPEKQQSLSLDVASGIAVKVIGSNKKTNDKGKEVLAFVILVGQARILDGTIVGIEKELWRVEKLYSDFLALDSKLKQRQNKGTANKIGKLPDKNLFHNNAPSKVDQRKIALEQYLQHIIALPLKDPKDLCEFLSTNMIDQEEKDYQQSGFKEGYLTKKGKNFGGWKSRFFVLNSPVLEYYESKGGNHLGSIRLTHAQIGRQQSNVNNDTEKDSENSYRHAFLILEPKSGSKNTTHTKHVLCAESDAERDEWVESLLQYVGEEEREIKKHSKKKFSKDSIAKVNAQPISQLGKTDLNTKLIETDSVIQQAQKEIRPDRRKGNNESLSSISITKSDSISHSSHHSHHHPSSSFSLSSSPSSSTNSLQQSESSDQSKNSFGGNQQQSMLSVSSNPIIKRSSMSVNREDSDRKVSPEPRDSTSSPVLGMSANNQSQHVKRHTDDNLHHEKRKGSRKTFFGSMFGSSNKDEKKKYQESRPDITRIVFGVPLDQAIAIARIKEGYELPAVVYRCIEYLDAKNATEEEGIYRLNGAAATIKFLKDRFNTEGDVDLLGDGEYYDVHAVAGLLKLYLRELPTSVLTRELHAEFVNVIDLLDRRDRINELGRLVSALPLSNYTLLRTLTGHLIRVVQNADVNKMTVRNIGIVFSPTLGIPAGVFSLFMAEFDYIFFTDSNGTAAPRTMEAPPSETNENERSSSEVDENNVSVDTSQPATKVGSDSDPISPTALSPITALRNRNIREDVTGRSNRNSMHYMDGAPENVVGLERKLTVSKTLKRDDSSDEEEVNDLALQADDDDAESSSADESTSSPPNSSIRSAPVSAPVSPRLPAPNGFHRPNSPSGLHVEFADNDTVPEMDSLESQRLRRLTVRNFTERDSMYEVFSENQRILDALNEGVNQNNNQNLNITNNSS